MTGLLLNPFIGCPSRTRMARRALAFSLLILAVALATPAAAFAHAYPVGSDPAPDATVDVSPATVTISFSERLEPDLSSAAVYDEHRQEVDAGPGRVDPRDPSLLEIALRPNLPKGTYTVVWHAISADDGHSTAGVFAFGVGKAAGLPVISAQKLGGAQVPTATPVGVLGRWLSYLGAALTLGTAVFALLVVGGNDRVPLAGVDATDDGFSGSDRPISEALRAVAFVALLALIAGQILRVVDELAVASFEPAGNLAGSPGVGITTLLFRTRFGTLWLVRSALIAVGAVVLLRISVERPEVRAPNATRTPSGPKKGRPGDGVAEPQARSDRSFLPVHRFPIASGSSWLWGCYLVVGVGLITDLALSGHAAAGSLLAYASLVQSTIDLSTHGNLYMPIAASIVRAAKVLTLVVDWLHLAATSAWIGGVVALAAVLGGNDAKAPRPGDLGRIVRRFSRVATVGMIVVIVTGLYNTWLYLDGPASYVATGYGQSLLLKHVVIVALLLAALTNRLVTVPLLTEGKKPSLIPSTVGRVLVTRPIAAVRVEAGLGLIVLLATGLLTSLSPARAPWQILLDPMRELALAIEPFRVDIPMGDGVRARLEINPGRVGPNRYSVQIEGDNGSTSEIKGASLTFTPLSLPSVASNEVRLAATGPDQFSGNGLAVSGDGLWRVAVTLDRADGSVLTREITLQATNRWAAVTDPAAQDALKRAAAAMARVRSARMAESLSDGAGGLVLDEYSFVAPDREEIVTPGGGAMIQIGSTVYQRDRGSPGWRTERDASPYRWPDHDYSYLTQGVGAMIVGERTIDGEPCLVVAFYSPPVGGMYEEWIGKRDHLIHQEVMSAPSHYMVNRYYDLDRPVTIEPPAPVDP